MALQFRPYPVEPQPTTNDDLNNLASVLQGIAQQRQSQKFLEQDRALKTAGLRKDYAEAVGNLGEERARGIFGPVFDTMGIHPTVQAWNQYVQAKRAPDAVVPDTGSSGSSSLLTPDEQNYLADATGFTQKRGTIEADRVQKGLQAKKLAKELAAEPKKTLDQLAAEAVTSGKMTLEDAMQMKRGQTEEEKQADRNKAKLDRERPKAEGSLNDTLRYANTTT